MKQSWPMSVLRNLPKETGEDYENGRSEESVPLMKSEPETSLAQTNTPPRQVTQQSLDMRVIVLRVCPIQAASPLFGCRPFSNLLQCVDPDPDDAPTPELENFFFKCNNLCTFFSSRLTTHCGFVFTAL